MVQPVAVGLDIAKNVFHAYGVNFQGDWARTIEKLGHQVRLMPPAYVKPT